MTPQEELLYLSDLLMQAALWRVDQDDGKCCLELSAFLGGQMQKPSEQGSAAGGSQNEDSHRQT